MCLNQKITTNVPKSKDYYEFTYFKRLLRMYTLKKPSMKWINIPRHFKAKNISTNNNVLGLESICSSWFKINFEEYFPIFPEHFFLLLMYLWCDNQLWRDGSRRFKYLMRHKKIGKKLKEIEFRFLIPQFLEIEKSIFSRKQNWKAWIVFWTFF